MRPIGIRGRLTITYGIMFAITLGIFGLVSYSVLKNRLDNALSDELTDRATALRGYLEFDNGQVALSYDPNDPEQSYFVQVATRYYQIYDAKTGQLLTQSPELDVLGLELTPEEVQEIVNGKTFYEVHTDQVNLRFRNEILRPTSNETYLLQIGTSMRQMQDTLAHFFRLLLWLVPVSIVLASLIGSWAAARALRPMANLATTADQIELSGLNKRLPIRGTGDELDQLAAAFNDMLSRLARTIDEMKQFTASISHELRTPLSVLRGEAEVALMQARSGEDYQRILSSQLEEFDKLTRMINQLLTLARAEAGEILVERKPVDLCELARLLTEQMTPIAESRQIELRAHCSEKPVVVKGDRNWLERVILNLLDNAIKFTPAGGVVDVRIDSHDGKAGIEVRDTGKGIPPEALTHVFERFYQADSARSGQTGAGLGLSLVKWIVDQHGGAIEVSSKPNAGSSFRVVFPLD